LGTTTTSPLHSLTFLHSFFKFGNPSTISTRHFEANVNIPEENHTNKNCINPPPPTITEEED
jgi:hypothetical protein